MKLKDCPFCGSKAHFEYRSDVFGYAKCDNALCGIGFFDVRESAIKKWNKRRELSEPELSALISASEKLCKVYFDIACEFIDETEVRKRRDKLISGA